jgi:hypothetical protein
VQLVLLQILLATRATFPGPEPVPPRVVEFLRYLADIAPQTAAERERDRFAKPIDVDIFLGYVWSSGLTVTDVLPGAPGFVRPDRLRRELKAERGLVFRYVVGLSRSALDRPSVDRHEGVLLVTLSDYVLTFATEGSVLKLKKLESTDPGGD